MDIKVIDNIKIKMVDELNRSIATCTQIRMAVAFAKMSGYQLIKESLDSFIQQNGRVTLLIGLDFHTTDPDVLRELSKYFDTKETFEMYCLSGNINQTATYHPKLYLFSHSNDKTTAIIGSSNLTRGGLENNVEINIEIRTDTSEPVITDLLNDFQQMELADRRKKPNAAYIDYYEDLYKISRRGKSVTNHPKYIEMIELEKALPTPKLHVNELIGWMKLVYEHLPGDEFATNTIYKYEPEFKQIYPENLNILAKIRQQLQFLRNIGLLKKTSGDRWIKTN
jgi:HKD family nuclease